MRKSLQSPLPHKSILLSDISNRNNQHPNRDKEQPASEGDTYTDTNPPTSQKDKNTTVLSIRETTPHTDLNSDSDEDILNERVSDEKKSQAREKASKIMGKSNIIEKGNKKDSWLVKAIKGIISSTDKVINKHKYKFENSRDAAKFNTKLLKKYQYDLTVALKREKGTILEAGSEFRPIKDLKPLFSNHVHWNKMEKIITEGITYNIPEIPEEDRISDLEAMITRGNHKSAKESENISTLLDNYEKEVRYGWMLPVTIESVKKIKGASVIPIGIAKQFTIDDKGKRKTKRRTTHDASFPPPSQQSINNMMARELLTECFYGHCLIRILHAIHIIRLTCPEFEILIAKLDIDAAYRRLHVLAAMAVRTITIVKRIAYILLRLPFGVANGPNDFPLISEPIMDLTNELLRDDTWHPAEVHAPIQQHLHQKKRRLHTEPPTKARPLFVDVPYHPAIADGYIDDIITVMVDEEKWVEKGRNAAPLAVHSMFRAPNNDDPIPRDNATSIRKLDGEGTPEEHKCVLGWNINTHKFRIYLPEQKARQWIAGLQDLLKRNKSNCKTME